MLFRVRVDGQDDETVTKFLEQYYSYVLVHHVLPHGNPHYHAYVEDRMSLSIDSFRARVKRYFKITERSDYSVKKCDDDKANEYVQYLFNTKHGNQPRMVKSHNFCDDVLTQCQKDAKDVSDDYELRSKEREKNKSTATIYQLGIELQQLLNENHVSEDPTIGEYTRYAIQICHKHHKSCEPNMLIKIVSTAMSLRQPDRLVQRVQEYFKCI